MEVNQSYIEFLLKLLNKEENLDIDKYQEELMVNLYLTLLSLSNLEYSDTIDQSEKEIISDFLRKLNNLKVKIQLKRKPEETNKLAEELINQYYENINILSIYIKDGIELENVINTMDAKSLTQLIDTTTKDKMNKEYSKEERNARRIKLLELLPSEYYIENNTIYIKNNDFYENFTIENFIEMFSYLLNPDNYSKLYSDKASQTAHDLVIANVIKTLIVNDTKMDELYKVYVPVILTYVSSFNITNYQELDTSKFNIENILISELYALAAQVDNSNNQNMNTPKWRNIYLPNEYLLNKLHEMINMGMYYIKDDSFILEHTDKKTNGFKVSIKIEDLKQILKTILESKLENNYSKKNIK